MVELEEELTGHGIPFDSDGNRLRFVKSCHPKHLY